MQSSLLQKTQNIWEDIIIRNEENIKNLLYLSPIILIVILVPVLVRYKIVLLNGEWFDYWNGDYVNYDFFSFFKAVITITLTIYASFMFVLRVIGENFKLKYCTFYLPLIVYCMSIVISTLYSEFNRISVYGYIQRFEGFWVLLAYSLLLFITFNFVTGKSDVKAIFFSLMIAASIVSIVGIFQFFGLDLFKSEVGTNIIFPIQLLEYVKNREFNTVNNIVYSTFGNSNYVGSYMAMVFPLSFGYYFYQKNTSKIIYGILTCLFFAVLIGSNSRAGIIGSIFATLVFLLFSRNILRERLSSFLILIPFFVILITMNFFSNGKIINKLSTINYVVEKDFASKMNIDLLDIIIRDDKAIILGENYYLGIKVNNNLLKFMNNESKEINTFIDEDNIIRFWDKSLNDVSISYKKNSNKILLNLMIKNKSITWFIEDDEIFIMSKLGTYINEIEHPKTWGFDGMERFASSRGYIWSRTFPLIKNNFFWGAGPDTFAAVFPQNDIIGKVNFFGKSNVIVDTPHNYYLQLLIGTGAISLFSILGILGYYILNSIRIFWSYKNIEDDLYLFGILFFIAIIGYLIAAFFNDSIVGVATSFWVFLGTGFSINYSLNKISSPI